MGFGGALILLFRTMAPGLTWEHFGEDGGELTLACAYLGVPHPSGYPLYVLLGRLFCLLPIGSFAFRTNLLSVVAGAAAAAAGVTIMEVVTRRLRLDLPRWSTCLLGVAAVLGYTLWSQSLITEVYALNAALSLWTVAALVRWHDTFLDRRPAGRWLFLASILWGLALGVHLTAAFMGLGLFLLLFATDKNAWRRRAFWYGAAGCIGLVILLYGLLAILAPRNAPVNWGLIRTGPDLLEHVSGAQYRYRMFVFTGREILNRIHTILTPLLRKQWGGGSEVLLAIGALWALWLATWGGTPEDRRYARRIGAAWILLWLPQALYSLNYNIDDLPVYFALSFAFLGLLFLPAAAAIGRLGLHAGLGPAGAGLLAAAVALVPAVGMVRNMPYLNISGDRTAGEFGRRAFAGMPAESLVLSDYDGRTNALLYERWLGTGRQSGTVVVLRTMLATRWYREHLRRLYPGLTLAEPGPEFLGLAWDSLCDHVGERILLDNASRPRFLVRDTLPFARNWHLVMAHGLFQVAASEQPGFRSEGRYWPVDLVPFGNSDYRGDPFLPGLRAGDGQHFPALGQGELRSELGVPFRLAPPWGRSGRASAITTCYARDFHVRLPLLASLSRGLHLAVAGGVSREASGTLAYVQPWYQEGPATPFPLADLPDFRDLRDRSLRFVTVPLDPLRIPIAVEIRSGNAISPEPHIPGVAVLAMTQETLSGSTPTTGGMGPLRPDGALPGGPSTRAP